MLRHRLAFRIELEVPGDTNMSKERVSVPEVSSECGEEVAAGAGCSSGNGQSSGPWWWSTDGSSDMGRV